MNQREATHRRLHELKMPHLCEQYPPLVEPFVLVGRAKDVFALVELKAKREQEFNLAIRNVREQIDIVDLRDTCQKCPYSPEARCTKPENKTCPEIDCEIWINKVLGQETNQHISDNTKGYWKHLGNED